MKISALLFGLILLAPLPVAAQAMVQGRVWCRFDRANSSESLTDTSCYATGQDHYPNPGQGWVELEWSDGVKNRIEFLEVNRHSDGTMSGSGRIDGEAADFTIGEQTCVVVRSNGNRVCFHSRR